MPDDTVLLERHFDTAFAAPDGIQKLRELILTLAMQGKSVPQDPKDQPASELLKAIEVEKQRLVKEGKIKQPKPLPAITAEELPYKLPDGWEWVRLHDYGIWKSGTTPSRTNSSYYGGDIPWVKSGEVKQGKIVETSETITQEALKSCSLDLNSIGSVLVAMYGANIGEVGVLEIEATTNQAVCACKPYLGIDNIFLVYLLTSLKQNFIGQGAGAAQPNISREKIIHTIVPLPPLAEQRRIVAKIDRLMARCDELEKLRAERNHKRITVHTAALDRLLTAKESSDFSTAWRFITQYFGELYSVKENVAELRKAILQLAVMGKLVPQDPTDEPASELLKAIEAEKQRLVKEGKIKQSKPLPEIKPQQVPYELPKGWNWVRLGDISQIIGGFAYKSNLFKTEGTRQVLRLGNIRPDLIRLNENPVFIDDSLGELTSELCLLKNDILITMTGTRSKHDYLYTVRVEENPMNGVLLYLNQRVGAIRLFSDARYMNLALKVEILKDAIFSSATGSANQANIGINNLREWIVPLPPLTEQHRIIAKTDRIMALCDQLDEQIDAATSKQTTLLNAVMTQV